MLASDSKVPQMDFGGEGKKEGGGWGYWRELTSDQKRGDYILK